MEQFLNVILNPYFYVVASALLIMGLTQLIKLIPVFKDNNWNVSFPVLFGYVASFGWAIATKFDIANNMEQVILLGTGIGTLSTTLYGIFKKTFNKDYKMSNEIEKSELYTFLSNLFSVDIKDFSSKTMTEKYSYVVSVASSLKNVIEKLQNNDKEGAVLEVKNTLSKFLTSKSVDESVDTLLDILKKEYNVIDKKDIQVENNNDLTKPNN